jgi:TRAP-type C4-dicarboxylate transport system substrate-binding protein
MAAAIETTAQQHGVRVLGLRKLPGRAFFARKPILAAGDLAGLKIRSPQLAVWIESYKSLGANPTPVNWNETFLALKTGLVDAAHGLPADVVANKWHLAAPHITALDDMFAIHAWFINEKRWQSLSAAEKTALQGVLDESMRWLAERSDALDLDAIVTMLKEGGGTFVSPSAARREQIAKAIGADRVKAFPEADLARLRAGSLEAARRLEGGKDWWGRGLVDQIDAIA